VEELIDKQHGIRRFEISNDKWDEQVLRIGETVPHEKGGATPNRGSSPQTFQGLRSVASDFLPLSTSVYSATIDPRDLPYDVTASRCASIPKPKTPCLSVLTQ
jgi:hypothetical protein